MKNFSELQATKQTINVGMVIDCEANAEPPNVIVRLNKWGWRGELGRHKTFEWEIDIDEPIELEILLHKKDYRTSPQTAVLLLSIRFDDFELLPMYSHVESYDNDHGWDEPTNYLGFNGIWRLRIDEPFYRWRHRVTGQGWLLEP